MKILAWNIQFFTKRRLDDDAGRTSVERAANAERTLANLLYIISTIEQANPDVVVILEPLAQQGDLLDVASGGGPDGLLYLLGQMQAWMNDMNTWDWRLVPPLRMNPRDHLASRTYTECAGVFWKNATLEFTGPWHWTVDGASPPTIGLPVAYNAPWDAAIGDAALGVPYTACGQSMMRSEDALITFPEEYNRRPFLTHFRERAAPNRTLKLYSVHTSPATAQVACARMLSILDMPPQANQITVVAGDFNLNLNHMNLVEADTLHQFPRYQAVRVVTPPTLINGNYEATLVKARPDATWADYERTEAYDYAIVGYGTGARIPGGFQPTVQVVNRVAGTPPPFNSDMGVKLATYPNLPPEDANNYSPLTIFRQRWNYGHIAQPRRDDPDADLPGDGTSDHIPILITV